MTVSSLTWKPDDWKYAIEGGKHALFRYVGHDSDFCGHVIRIAKVDLASASYFHDKTDSRESAPHVRTSCQLIENAEESAFPSQKFHREVVQPLLGPCYLDLARVLRLSADCCSRLYQGTLASGLIPSSRLPSWECINPNGSTKFANATLLPDYTHISHQPCIRSPLSPSSTSNVHLIHDKPGTVLSVEIKPKAGYVTSSPLVLPSHRCKYHRTRFSLQQELMCMGHIQKGWRKIETKDSVTRSHYSPLDLFSGNVTRIRKVSIASLQD